MDLLLDILDVIEWVLFFVLLAIGYFAGRVVEKRHYASIRKREKELQSVLAFGARFPPDLNSAQQCHLVTGCVVISSDYFKKFVLGLRQLVGGRSRGYETLLDRARREAALRMKAEAKRLGAKVIVNVKFESTSISGNRGGVPAFEVLAFGTALVPRP
jgi:uncharacterized protein YbjQ (UPF0145 family)